ncbi:hypothetical protein [Actinomycetospora sp. CA-053990]|uniref:hypothetical protein n=1 Tax=Actinomycetospora sp. CA-053990 TaxID=3239891 RepID=UPI003D8BB86F
MTRQSAVPGLLWAMIAGFGIVAACLLYPTIVFLRLGAAMFSSPALGLLGLAIALVSGSFVVAFARVGYGLYEGSRVARGVAFVLAGYLLLSCFAMPVATGLTVVLAVGSLGVVAVLAFAPSARAWFAGPWCRGTELPTSIVVAQTVILYSSGITALLAATLLVAGIALLALPYAAGTAGLMIVTALVCAAVAAVGFWAKAAVARAERLARVLVTVATAADLVVVVLLSAADESVLPLLAAFGLHAAVVVALWLPADARRFFGEAALPVVENLHRHVLESGRGASAGPIPPAPIGYLPPLPPPTPPLATGRHADPRAATSTASPLPWGPPAGPPPPVPPRPGPVSRPPGTMTRVGPPSGRRVRPDPIELAATAPESNAPAFCGRCGAEAVPGAVHCVRCGSRLLGYRAAEPQP